MFMDNFLDKLVEIEGLEDTVGFLAGIEEFEDDKLLVYLVEVTDKELDLESEDIDLLAIPCYVDELKLVTIH